MGKNQHSKDKLYIIPSEFARDWGGYKKRLERLPFRCLPYYCCGLSLLPFEEPLGTKVGIVFDAKYILPFLSQYGRNPVSGEPMKVSDLFPLHFHKNESGEYHCPITLKIFTDHSHIVAIRKSGNVYAAEAIENLCRKPQNWTDLLTEEPFDPAEDLITIQHPMKTDVRKIDNFDFVRHNAGVNDPIVNTEPTIDLRGRESILEEAKARAEARLKLLPGTFGKPQTVDGDGKRSTLYSTGEMSMSFTSTVAAPTSRSAFRLLTAQESRQEIYNLARAAKEKGYVRISTSLGDINVQLHCDLVPETCDNFLRHARSGFYEGTIFHRIIGNFMAQGGDPLGTGRGGKSAFEDGDAFKDEFHPKLRFFRGGVLAMANNGKHTNKSQFFITFKSAEHLNNRHSIFGHVVGGMDVVKKIEKVEVDERDRPREPPVIQVINVFNDPLEVIREAQAKAERDKEAANLEAAKPKPLEPEDQPSTIPHFDTPIEVSKKRHAPGPANIKTKRPIPTSAPPPVKAKKSKMTFDAW